VRINVTVTATGDLKKSVDLDVNGGAITIGQWEAAAIAYGKTDLLNSGATITAAVHDGDTVFETNIDIDIPEEDLYYAFDFASDTECTQAYWFPDLPGSTTFNRYGTDIVRTGYNAQAALDLDDSGVALVCTITVTPYTP
jgi:hypothetical protein